MSTRMRPVPGATPRRAAPGAASSVTEIALRLRFLGAFQVAVGGSTVLDSAWRLRKARSLVKLLALHPGQRLPREQAMDLLWPELDPIAAANNLRGALHAARRVLAPQATITGQDGAFALEADGPLWLDVTAFEAAAVAARRDPSPAAYQRALDLYGGELLPEDRYEDWTIAPRDRLRGLHLTLLLEFAALQEAAADWPSGIATLQRVLATEPAHEEAHTGLMRLYALAGQRARALQQWDQLVAALRRDLDAAPDPAARSLRDEIAAGRFPPQDAGAQEVRPGRHKGNLPIPLTALIGRDADLLAVKAAIGQARLLTLTGAGGCGKTRLALAAATDLLAAYPGGVWLVELAALADPALVPGAVAAALALREEPDRPLLDTIAKRLAGQATLLVIDNCEHLREACAEVVSILLTACPRLRVLATSRAALGLPGEATWRVPSLQVPAATPASMPRRALAELAAVPAVRLFIERVRQRQPAFALTPENARVVAEIARRLDGIPLALELAAARVAVLPVAELAARLDHALPLLGGGARAAAPRHRTLRATLDWSHALLAPPHQALLRRLSVFAGGAALAAIEAVCAEGSMEHGAGREASQEEQFSILDALDALIDHSLVQANPGATEGRYLLLEIVRQYATAHLAASGEREAIQRHHAAYYLALAERADTELGGQEALAWLDRLEAEHDNLRAALGWLHAAGENEEGLRLAGALARFWYLRGHPREGRAWLESLLALTATVSQRVRAKATYGLAVLAYFQSDLAVATTRFNESEALWRAVGDPQGLAGTLNLLAIIHSDRADYARAEAIFAECLELQRSVDDQHGIARTLNNRAAIARHQGERQRARAYYEEAIAIWRDGGDVMNTSTALLNLGQLLQELGDYARAEVALNESLALPGDKGNPSTVAYAQNSLGTGARDVGDHARARQHFDQALATFRQLGNTTEIGRTLINLAQVVHDTGDYAQAATLAGESLDLARSTGHQRNTAHALLCLGDVARSQGNHDSAREYYVESLQSFRTAGNPLGITQVLEHLALLATLTGQAEMATSLLALSAAQRASMGTPAPPIERAEQAQAQSTLRRSLGDDAFAAAWSAGQGLAVDDAIRTFALTPPAGD